MMIARRSVVLSSVIFVPLGAGSMILFLIRLAQVPDWILQFMKAIDAGPYLLLLVVNIVLRRHLCAGHCDVPAEPAVRRALSRFGGLACR